MQNLQQKTLREFGLLMAGFIAILFGSLIPYLRYHQLSAPPFYVALVFLCLAVIYPISLKPIYHVWMKIGHVLGWFNSRLLLSIVFYILFLPMSLILKLFGKKFLQVQTMSADSFHVKSQQRKPTHMEKPY